MASCPGFWCDVGSQLVVLVLGGVLFTVIWGLMLARRDVLLRVFDRVSSMMDDVTVAFTSFYNFLRTCRDGRDKLPEDKEKYEAAETKVFDELFAQGQATYAAMTREGTLRDASLTFKRDNVSGLATDYLRRLQSAQAQLLDVHPLDPKDDPKIEAVKYTLVGVFDNAEALRHAMLDEIRFSRLLLHLWRAVRGKE